MIRIRVTDDGTYTVYRDGTAMVSGLTRDQAHAVARVLNAKISVRGHSLDALPLVASNMREPA